MTKTDARLGYSALLDVDSLALAVSSGYVTLVAVNAANEPAM